MGTSHQKTNKERNKKTSNFLYSSISYWNESGGDKLRELRCHLKQKQATERFKKGSKRSPQLQSEELN